MSLGSQYLAMRLVLRRRVEGIASRIRWRKLSFDGSPVLFANAMPKSGSKLLMQIMQGVQRIGPFEPLDMRPIRMLDGDGKLRSFDDISRELGSLRPGDIRLGYLHGTKQILDILTQDGWCSFFLLRDPRDLLVSHVYYATEIHEEHSMRPIYASLPDFGSRLEIAISGTDDYPYLPNVLKRYERFLPFMETPGICVLRYEEIRLDPDKAIRRVLDHIASRSQLAFGDVDSAIAVVKSAIRPSRSPTFRKGVAGDWKTHFSANHKRLFKDIAGDLLVRLGYERDDSW